MVTDRLTLSHTFFGRIYLWKLMITAGDFVSFCALPKPIIGAVILIKFAISFHKVICDIMSRRMMI